MEVEAVAGALYQLDPSSFVSERDARVAAARREGDRPAADAIRALKRPSPPAWAVNLLSRAYPDELGGLVELGEQLRQAQASLSGEELRRLSRERHKVVVGLARQARSLAAEKGRPLSANAGRQVEDTLNAALADPEAAIAVASGRLVRSLDHAGMGPVDLDGAVAGPQLAPAPGPKPGQRRSRGQAGPASAQLDAEIEKIKVEVAAAEHEQRASERVARDAGSAFEAATDRRTAAEAEVHRLEEELGAARVEAEAARTDAGVAARSRRDAEGSEEAARRQDARQAEERLSALEQRRSGSGK